LRNPALSHQILCLCLCECREQEQEFITARVYYSEGSIIVSLSAFASQGPQLRCVEGDLPGCDPCRTKAGASHLQGMWSDGTAH